jgi:hypothetical protein
VPFRDAQDLAQTIERLGAGLPANPEELRFFRMMWTPRLIRECERWGVEVPVWLRGGAKAWPTGVGMESVGAAEADFVSEYQLLWCYGFRVWDLESASSGDWEWPPVAAVLGALRAIREHRASGVRERAFSVWTGEDGRWFWVGVPEGLAGKVEQVIRGQLKGVPGYTGAEGGTVPDLPLAPRLRYEYGEVIEYRGADLAGTELVDDEKAGPYGSGLTLKRRVALPAWLNRGERYGRGGTRSGPEVKDKSAEKVGT